MSVRCLVVAGLLMLALLPMPAPAAVEASLRKYAEAVDLLDRWRGDRSVLDAAHDRLTELLLEAPEFAPAHVELARWYLMNSRNNEAALKALERSEALDPGFAGTYVLRGYVFQEQRRFEEALAELDKAEAIGTDNPWLPINRGLTLQRMGQHEQALPLFQQVFEANIDDPKAWPTARNELLDHADRSGDEDAAERIHLRAMELKPEDPAQVIAYAGWLGERRRFEDAITTLRTRSGAPSGQEREIIVLQLLSAKAFDAQTQAPASDAARTAFAQMSAQAQALGLGPTPSFEDWAQQALEYSRSQQR